jgi:hypothetical protein
MSRAIASARQRRAGLTQPEPQSVPKSAPTTTESSGLTLPQVIALVDIRLSKLEKFMKDTQENGVPAASTSAPSSLNVKFEKSDAGVDNGLTDLNEVLDDFNNRFVMLATEISQLKDVVMKLQTYTMDVNKMLLEERVNVLSDLGDDNNAANKSVFIMDNTNLSETEINKIEDLSPAPTSFANTGMFTLSPSF